MSELDVNEELGPEFTLEISENVSNDMSLDMVTNGVLVVEIGAKTSSKGISASNIYMSSPDILDDTDTTYFYFGWENINNGWLVRRQLRSTSSVENATMTNNAALTLSSAWVNKNTLQYS